MTNAVVVPPLPQTSAPRFLLKPPPPDDQSVLACPHHTAIDPIKVEQTPSPHCSRFQPQLQPLLQLP